MIRGASPLGLPYTRSRLRCALRSDRVARSRIRARIRSRDRQPAARSLLRLSVKVRVGVIEPVLADGREDVEFERVIERFGLMLHP